VALAKGFKGALAETNEPIPVGNENTPNLSSFYYLHQAIEVFVLRVESTPTILHPFIDRDGVLMAIDLKRFQLVCQIRLLGQA
jgi:hypothetical protein